MQPTLLMTDGARALVRFPAPKVVIVKTVSKVPQTRPTSSKLVSPNLGLVVMYTELLIVSST
jgi:hypothetical protein